MSLPRYPDSITELPELRGPSLTLRPPRDSDRADRLTYSRDPEYRRMVGGDPRVCPLLTSEEVDRWYRQMLKERFLWVIKFGGKCIGAARLHQLDWENRRARYVIGIFAAALIRES